MVTKISDRDVNALIKKLQEYKGKVKHEERTRKQYVKKAITDRNYERLTSISYQLEGDKRSLVAIDTAIEDANENPQLLIGFLKKAKLFYEDINPYGMVESIMVETTENLISIADLYIS